MVLNALGRQAVAHWRGHTASRSRGSEEIHERRRSRVRLLSSSPRRAFPSLPSSFLPSFSPPFHPPINNFRTRKTESRAEPANFPVSNHLHPPLSPILLRIRPLPRLICCSIHPTNPRGSPLPPAAARSQARTAGAAAGRRLVPPPPPPLIAGLSSSARGADLS